MKGLGFATVLRQFRCEISNSSHGAALSTKRGRARPPPQRSRDDEKPDPCVIADTRQWNSTSLRSLVLYSRAAAEYVV